MRSEIFRHERSLCREAIGVFGKETQLIITMEECGELIQACSKALRRHLSARGFHDIAEEVADVEIMCEQLRVICGDKLVDANKEAKLKRLSSLLQARRRSAPQ